MIDNGYVALISYIYANKIPKRHKKMPEMRPKMFDKSKSLSVVWSYLQKIGNGDQHAGKKTIFQKGQICRYDKQSAIRRQKMGFDFALFVFGAVRRTLFCCGQILSRIVYVCCDGDFVCRHNHSIYPRDRSFHVVLFCFSGIDGYFLDGGFV